MCRRMKLRTRTICPAWAGFCFMRVAMALAVIMVRALFFLEGHMKNATVQAFPVQCVKGSAIVLFVQIHETEAPTSPRHNVRSQADRLYSSKLREQLI